MLQLPQHRAVGPVFLLGWLPDWTRAPPGLLRRRVGANDHSPLPSFPRLSNARAHPPPSIRGSPLGVWYLQYIHLTASGNRRTCWPGTTGWGPAYSCGPVLNLKCWRCAAARKADSPSRYGRCNNPGLGRMGQWFSICRRRCREVLPRPVQLTSWDGHALRTASIERGNADYSAAG